MANDFISNVKRMMPDVRKRVRQQVEKRLSEGAAIAEIESGSARVRSRKAKGQGAVTTRPIEEYLKSAEAADRELASS